MKCRIGRANGLNEARPDQQRQREAGRKRSQRAVNGDCSRGRRFRDAVRRAYYARHRQMRFARRCLGESIGNASSIAPQT
jgi:hypothetical protein